MAADHICANLLTGSVSFSISDIEFISQKIHMRVSARVAGCKNECIPSIRKSINFKMSIFIVICCLPGKDLLQLRRPKPDTAFSRDVSASGIPLLDVFRRQRFLKLNFFHNNLNLFSHPKIDYFHTGPFSNVFFLLSLHLYKYFIYESV